MKKFIFAIMCVVGIATAYAENENAATSKEYVDTELATKQPTIPAEGANVVMTFDSTATDGIGTKNIYDPSGSYMNQQNALVTAATANSAVQMAINGEFICTEYSTIDPTDCWLWGIKTQENFSGSLPPDYTQLEYLEFDGQQYINTNVIFAHEIARAEINAKIIAGSAWSGMFGAQDAPYTNSALLVYHNNPYVGIASFPHIKLFSSDVFGHVILSGDNGTATIQTGDNKIYTQQYTGSIISSYPWLIGKLPNYLSSVGFIGYISNVKLYDNNVLVFNGIPARRNTDGVLGMYDSVSNTFFTNSGTGTFVAGPVASYLPQNQQ